MKYTLLLILTLPVFASTAPAPLGIDHLRCEGLHNPQGIEVPAPRLSWTLTSAERGAVPTAYQLLVASSPELLAKDQGDVWDSGCQPRSVLAFVRYEGITLTPHTRYWWKVRVWDAAGVPSPWSAAARWNTGLQTTNDWQADWIGREAPPRKEYLSDASWIWADVPNAATTAPLGECAFLRTVDLPADRTIINATFRVAADDKVTILLNGREIGSRSGPNSTKEMDLTHRLQPGANYFALLATNEGVTVNSAGLIAWLKVEFATGEPLLVVSNSSWRAQLAPSGDWKATDFNDATWKNAAVIGPVGCKPWGSVQHAESRRLPARHLRQEFSLEKQVRQAIVSYSGLGVSELYLNGVRVGDEVLSPAMAHYPETAFYVTHDVTSLVKQGRNALAAIVGNGRFYAPRSQVYASMPSFGSPMLRLQMTVEFSDGSKQTVVSNRDWRVTEQGPIVANNEYDGEEYDARRELPGWNDVGFKDSSWIPVDVFPAPSKTLCAQPCEPIRITEEVTPVSVKSRGAGIYLFDLGQNIVGFCRLKLHGSDGERITLRHAESLKPDGSLYLANLRGAKATEVYTCRGEGEETYQPRFTYHGFRYVEVSGCSTPLSLDSLRGCVVHDDLTPVGHFQCSNELVNAIYQNILWGTRGNYRSVPTDCPQRDERQGWLGDRLEVARGETYLFDVQAFYEKWLGDIRDSQLSTGSLPDVAPAHWPLYTDNVVWPSAAFTIPKMLRTQYGDDTSIRKQYASLRRWIEFMRPNVKEGLIDRDKYGDWCVPPEEPTLIHSQDPARTMNTTLLASLFFAHDLGQLSSYAKQIGEHADAENFASEAQLMRNAINAKYFDAGRQQYDNGAQSTSVLPLALGMCPLEHRSAIALNLARKIEVDTRGHIGTGLVGGQYLCRTLTDAGRADLVLKMLTTEDYPGWGYMVRQGATTVWELWNGDTADPAMNSGNHVMLVGDLVTWLFEDLAGIAPAAPGFREIEMRPQVLEGLDWVRASHRSPFGVIRSEWRREAGRLAWKVSIPPGATARAYLPADPRAKITESGQPLTTALGVSLPRGITIPPEVELASGEYVFEISQP